MISEREIDELIADVKLYISYEECFAFGYEICPKTLLKLLVAYNLSKMNILNRIANLFI
jgi:hypothetical protein